MMMLMLLQHGYCTFVIILFETFSLRLFVNLTDVHTSTFLQICNHSWSCRTSILEGATVHRMNWCKFLWGNPCIAIETFFHWDSCLWDFGYSTHFSHSAAWKSSETDSIVIFARLKTLWRKLEIVSFRTRPVGFPLPTISNISLSTLFCPLILDHGVSFIISISDPRNTCFVNLARYFFSPSSSICDNQDLLSSDESPGHTIPIRSWVSRTRILYLYNPSKMSSDGFRRATVNRSA